MNLIKIGESFVNLDNVTEVTHYPKTEHNAEHYTIGYNGLSGEMCMWVEGEQFDALRYYLTNPMPRRERRYDILALDVVAHYQKEMTRKANFEAYNKQIQEIKEACLSLNLPNADEWDALRYAKLILDDEIDEEYRKGLTFQSFIEKTYSEYTDN